LSTRIDIKRTDFYNELDKPKREIFDCIRQKYIHNIDTLYYTIFLKNDCNENSLAFEFITKLLLLKEQFKKPKTKEEKNINFLPFRLDEKECGLVGGFETNLQLTKKHYAIYEYCLTVPDKYDVFISDYLPNSSTPRIVIQLRSFYLWGDKYNNCINDSYNEVKKILDCFHLEIDFCRENRIDYCYHTNSIQNSYSFFSDKKIKKDMKTSLDKYQKIGNIYRDDITLDYFALGQRKSNNLFIRIYNKSREVIEEGYKSFFFAIWKANGLISEYDLYCYEFAFSKKSFNALEEAKLRYYIDFGCDQRVKSEFQKTLDNKNVKFQDIKDLANSYMPKITIINNIEFQTKRKFYCNADMLACLPIKEVRNAPELDKLYQILDNRDIILDYITSESLSFGKKVIDKKFVYSDWWERLRSCKIDALEYDFRFIRNYNYKCDIDKITKRAINSIASYGVYKRQVTENFVDDISDMLCYLNDNDNVKMMLGDFNTGEVLNLNSNVLKDYKLYKEKKYKVVKNRLPKSIDNDL